MNGQGWPGNVPNSVEAEEAVLGALLLAPENYYLVAAFLKAEDFFILRHQYIWRAMATIADRGDPLDYLILVHELKAMGRLQDIGGEAYLTKLLNAAPSAAHVYVYGQLVKKAATRRQLMALCDQIKSQALDEQKTVDIILSETSNAIYDLVAQSNGTTSFHSLLDVLKAYWDEVEAVLVGNRDSIGIPTTYKSLDGILKGLKKRALYLVAGRPGMGKSALLLSMALEILTRFPAIKIVLFTQEMSTTEFVARASSWAGGLPIQHLQDPMTLKEFGGWARFVKGAGAIQGCQLMIIDDPQMTPAKMRGALRLLVNGGFKPDIIMEDYIQLMNADHDRNNESEFSRVSSVSRECKQIAGEFDCPFVAAAQLNRQPEGREDKRPRLSDLRSSGSLEQDADCVMFLYRDEVYNPDTDFPNTAEVIVAKHRNGPLGTAELYFEKTLTKFVNGTQREIDLKTV